ncbi:hypothetical protein Hanom_Chr04g00382821 [Helianthus anomalus]
MLPFSAFSFSHVYTQICINFVGLGSHNLAICFQIGCIVVVFMLVMMSLHDVGLDVEWSVEEQHKLDEGLSMYGFCLYV